MELKKFSIIFFSFLLLILPLASAQTCERSGTSGEMSVSTTPSPLKLYHGETGSITVKVKNNNVCCPCKVQFKITLIGEGDLLEVLGDGVTYTPTKETLTREGDEISPGATDTEIFEVKSPLEGEGSSMIIVEATCREPDRWVGACWCPGSDYITCNETIYLYYEASPEEKEAESNIEIAETLIGEALTLLNEAKTKMDEVSELGGDITYIASSIRSAETSLENAQTYLSSAKEEFSNLNWLSAKDYATKAQSYATSAKDYANSAKTEADRQIAELERMKTEASNAINLATSLINKVKENLKKTEELINNATIIGLDTSDAEAAVATSRLKIETAEKYLSEASMNFELKKWDLAKSKANSAKVNADEADWRITNAYESLWRVYVNAREAAEALIPANEKVSLVNEILTKLAYTIRNLEKYGVEIEEINSVYQYASSALNRAEDLLSEAKNRIKAGEFRRAAQVAIQSKTEADSAYNRLDTIILKMKFQILDALEASISKVKSQLYEANSSIEGASKIYGIDPKAILAAREDLVAAELATKEAESTYKEVEGAEDFVTLISKTQQVFSKLEDVETKIKNGLAKVNEAKKNLTIKIVAGGLGAMGIGIGILGWKKRWFKQPPLREVTKKKIKKEGE